jgi:hypothetical protein
MASLKERGGRARVLRVLPAVRGWKVHVDGAGLPMSVHETREAAIAGARVLAGRDDEVVVHDGEGCVVSWYPWSLRSRVA